MQENFFALLEEILHTPQISKRFALFESLLSSLSSLCLDHTYTIRHIGSPIYQGICKIVHPTKISRPKILKNDTAMASFLHSIAHIEYSAIDLALDASYRFRNLPMEFYLNWIEVAKEEIQHFQMLRSLLQRIGFDYGDFEVHSNLFDAMKATPIFADRMALVHRGLEAGGLDANPFVVQKVSKSSHHLRDEILQVLQVILKDEISHVSKGDKWWKFSNDSRSFEEILRHYSYTPPKILNTQARLQCGFSPDELSSLQNFHLPHSI
ncbi:ferritin-like domain-containing protein [Helicobacter kayseriensis]|uniref:ferritin-like domain-containing protein n=1 Tax=Helicobacter kayseriensis TaxID=2905877 RepID=UPI001E30CDED|nr:ferritin-like domain-containing protein [Helicobacter kayseriensis]MCE3046856.1 ferritin-like domain-containing protein [Helicobacter kayseriensis]MCE3047842.1 ferritin-like domain-containing protein [Helicobacter kayseriensis]